MSQIHEGRITNIGDVIVHVPPPWLVKFLNPSQVGLKVPLRTEDACRAADIEIRAGRYAVLSRAGDACSLQTAGDQ